MKTTLIIVLLFLANQSNLLQLSIEKEEANKENSSEEPSFPKIYKKFNDTKTSYDLLNEMGFGWNLGNSLEAWEGKKQNEGLESEISWGNPYTSPELIKELVDKGMTSIRLPVTWHNHIIDNNYTIDPKWMNRVKQVVDWCIEAGMYVILNTQHDVADISEASQYGKGYYPLRKHQPESEKFLKRVWGQIAKTFNNEYDEHLIFDIFNEPRLKGHKLFEWICPNIIPECEEAFSVINDYYELCLKVIRESGGNNQKRFVLFASYGAKFYSSAYANFELPDDTKYNPTSNIKTLVSLHLYMPNPFCHWPFKILDKFWDSYKPVMDYIFNFLFDKFTSKGIRVVIGEMGAVDKNNTLDRIAWGEYFLKQSRKLEMPSLIWDNNIFDNSKSASEVFGQLERNSLTWKYDEMMNSFVEAGQTPFP